jgi:hypothetical protein
MAIRYPFTAYHPGRFSGLAGQPFARELWHYLADDETINTMVASAESGKPPILPLLDTIESRWETVLSNPLYAEQEIDVFINNQIKQIMELTGFENTGCSRIPDARFISLSGIYQKKQVQ